jgi:hypothetical protein
MIDGNSNMKSSDLSNTLSQLSLKEAILDKHGLQGLATHKRNATSSPIDGIWISPGLQVSQGGYFAYDQVIPSDHRCIWIDISFMVAFRQKQPRRLHCKDPRLVQNYIKLYHKYAEPLDLFCRVQDFKKTRPMYVSF